MESDNLRPHKAFGQRLRYLRERANKSRLEVSYAVEVEEALLARIESGIELPEEDILMLLMDHFDVSEQESVKLWELAGYDKHKADAHIAAEQLKQIMMVIPVDSRVAFSDVSQVSGNRNGLVIDFALSAGQSQLQPVSKVGLSLEHARQLIVQLQSAVAGASSVSRGHLLAAPKTKPNRKKSS